MVYLTVKPRLVGLLNETITAGDLDGVCAQLEETPALLHETMYGEVNFLHYAAREGKSEICDHLIQSGLVLNGIDVDGRTPLCNAASYGQPDTVRFLLECGALVDGVDVTLRSPLIAAARNGHAEVARLLVEARADINRECLREPFTALAYAEFYSGVKDTQATVDLLREHGAINPYINVEPRDWTGARGQVQLELLEHVFGRVHPVPFQRGIAGETVTVHRTRFSSRKYLFHMLSTVDLAERAGVELALCMRTGWPLHDHALEKNVYRWPVDLVYALAAALLGGRDMPHGDVLESVDPVLENVSVPERIKQWLLVAHESTESVHGRMPGSAPTLLVVPHLAKTPLKPGKKALGKADSKAKVKWDPPAAGEGRNALVVPLCFEAPWIGKE